MSFSRRTLLKAAATSAIVGSAGMSSMARAEQFTEHFVPREQGRVYAREYPGSGPAFVFMHGIPDNLHIYDRLIPSLAAAGKRVVVFDFLGYGASDKPTNATYGFKQQIGDLKAVIAALNLGKIIPVGHDASGPAAINFAIDNPDSVVSLCILNTFYHATPGARLPELVELFATPSLRALALSVAGTPDQLAWLLQFQQSVFREALVERQRERFSTFLAPIINANFLQEPSSGPAFVQMASQIFEEVTLNTSRLSALRAMDVPVKLIWGKNDPYFDTKADEEFRSHLNRSSLLMIEAGHWPQIDEPEQVAKGLLS
jgi:haloalkane dehalogenase